MSSPAFMDREDRSSASTTPRVSPIPEVDTSHSQRNALICVLVFTVCALLTNPVANMPFSDEFSYDKTALEFARTGHVLYNGWATAMLGWLIPWGAIFIKIFGFSFTGMRVSMLPIDAATVYLFHQILRRFGINSRNAIFGTLAFALSPIFMPSAVSFMTDVPGMMIIFVCLYMCQQAVKTASDRTAIMWLASAAAFNVAAGTVRQIAWLGALVMVPSTVWLLRKRRGIKTAGIVLWALSIVAVLVFLHWFNGQPYSVPEHIIWAQITWLTFPHLAAQLAKMILCLLLILLPFSVAWLPSAHELGRSAWLRVIGVLAIFIAFELLANALGRMDTWLMPWLMYLLPEQSSLRPGMFGTLPAMTLWIRFAISIFVIAAAAIALEHELERRPTGRVWWNQPLTGASTGTSWTEIAWLLGPFSLSYVLLLMPRGAFDLIQDRYMIGLVPSIVVALIKLYEERVGPKLPPVSVAMLVLFALYAVAGTHDFYAESRAQVHAIQMVEGAGVARNQIQAGFPADGWIQIENGGHINEPRIKVPADAYNPVSFSKVPDGCRDGFTNFAPAIHPKYFVLFPWFKNPSFPPPSWCFVHADFPPVRYTTWLPPFHETIYVNKLPSNPDRAK
ncbi:MAG: hypothetical protein V4587_17445 [Acidobacteriota bacterium]